MNKNNSKQKIIDIWDKVALNFGQVGPNYWECFGNKLVDYSNIKEKARVLDIGMGRGASLFPAATKSGEYGQVIGIDISENMVRETKREITKKSVTNIKVMTMDAEELQFEDEAFDNIICGFSIGCLLFSDSKLGEVSRILKVGGEFGCSIWGVQPDQKWLVELTNKYLPAPEVKKPQLKKSEEIKFSTGEDIKNILKSSGFVNIRIYEESPQVIYKDKNEWWEEMWCNAVRGTFEAIENLGEDVLNNFKAEVFKRLEDYVDYVDYVDYRGISFTMPVIYAFGEKY